MLCLVCEHAHTCTACTHSYVWVPDLEVNHKSVSWTLSSRSNFDPLFLPGCPVSVGLDDSYLSCTHLSPPQGSPREPCPLTGDWLGQWTPCPWACFPSPVTMHPPRSTLAPIILLSVLISLHLLFTEGLSFFLDPKTLLRKTKYGTLSWKLVNCQVLV